ncbi:hypothetical protein [Tissierella creatinophila]|uniref:Uncharacterized protein n=1 Tax=Tissierella creatinophila DSM 6911 TaxID=1123403 RepID=A0A1U7M3S7_TISCR|nr:hypothetical protein [Tissierella creatinophila]OLS01974.1 hypothetical protein TICRE_21160 [Tissierella creatinophila DSM 6911]
MKKSIVMIVLVSILAFSSIWIVFGKNGIPIDDNTDIKIEENEEIELKEVKNGEESESIEPDEFQSGEENENIELEESKFDEESLMRLDSQNGIDMAVIFNNPLEEDKDYLVFKVMINNHRIDLENIKYAELAKLRISDGTIITEGFQWELEGGSGHHVSGYLKLPKSIGANNVISANTDSIQLDIVGIKSVGSLTFKWDKEVIDQYNNGGTGDEK